MQDVNRVCMCENERERKTDSGELQWSLKKRTEMRSLERSWISIHQREFRHITKLPLITLSNLVSHHASVVVFVISHSLGISGGSWLKRADKGLSKVRPAAHIPNITKELHVMSSQKSSKASGVSNWQIQMTMGCIRSPLTQLWLS